MTSHQHSKGNHTANDICPPDDIRSADASREKTAWQQMKAWAVLLSVLAFLWSFAVWLGPWMETRIPVFNEIVRTIDRDDIDSGAYFYTEIKGAYEGERYLRNALELGDPEQARFTPLFFSGVFCCIAILAIGWRYLPND